MVTWENNPIIIQDYYTQAKAYYKNIARDFETYMQNSGGKTGKMGYESTNHMADMGDKIRKYIQEIASTTIADMERTAGNLANISKASRAKDAQIDSIMAQIKLLTNTVAILSKLLANKENNGSGGNIGRENSNRGNGGDGGGLGGKPRRNPTRNMGNYCWSCGHHPMGMKHDSHTCNFEKEGHKDDATATNRMGGNNFLLQENMVKPSQHDHVGYKGKSASR
jgi:hypothetical protein